MCPNHRNIRSTLSDLFYTQTKLFFLYFVNFYKFGFLRNIHYHIIVRQQWNVLKGILWVNFDFLKLKFVIVMVLETMYKNINQFGRMVSELYPEWPHRQGGCLACWSCKVDPSCGWDYTDLYYARGTQGVLPIREGGCDQSIGSAVSDAIVCSWLWSMGTRSLTLGYFSRLLQSSCELTIHSVVVCRFFTGSSWP